MGFLTIVIFGIYWNKQSKRQIFDAYNASAVKNFGIDLERWAGTEKNPLLHFSTQTRCAQTCSVKQGFFSTPAHSSKSIPQCFSPQKRCPPSRTPVRFHAYSGASGIWMLRALTLSQLKFLTDKFSPQSFQKQECTGARTESGEWGYKRNGLKMRGA